jgi:hypothetical protein
VRRRPPAPTTWPRTVGAGPPTPEEIHLAMQRTLVLAKPDAVQRGLIGEIIGRFERKGLKVVGLRLLSVSREMAAVAGSWLRRQEWSAPAADPSRTTSCSSSKAWREGRQLWRFPRESLESVCLDAVDRARGKVRLTP